MARRPKPTKEYDALAMVRELNAAIDAAKPQSTAIHRNPPQSAPNSRDYRRALFESLFT